jgi:aminoglycoside phosphotransferase (APT) family kinase protein
MNYATPDEDIAADIVRSALGESPRSVRRFPLGMMHFVYDVVGGDGRAVVLRVARPAGRASLAGAVYWSRLLRPLGVPLPELIAHDLDGRLHSFPYLLMERLPGTDLGEVYPQLSSAEKAEIAASVARAQALAGSLPRGDGYGFFTHPGLPFPHASWEGVIRDSLARSRSHIERAGLMDSRHVARVEACLPLFADYFARVPSQPFLDDTTTKNVIVHQGRLSGIVDVDCLCYGDPLLTPALTRMSLLNKGYDTEYVDAWCTILGIAGEQHAALQFYTALFCVIFMGELGQTFNRAAPLAPLPGHFERLVGLLDGILSTLGK